MCRSATRRRGLPQGRSSAPGRTRAVSACSTRAIGPARSRQSAQLCAAAQGQPPPYRLRSARSATRRTGGAGAVRACGAGSSREVEALRQRRARACPGCACVWSCAPTNGTEARACWCRRAAGATLQRPWSALLIATGPQRRPLALGRHDEPQRPEPPPARACCWYLCEGVIKTRRITRVPFEAEKNGA